MSVYTEYVPRLIVFAVALLVLAWFIPAVFIGSYQSTIASIERHNYCWETYGEYTSLEGIPIKCYSYLRIKPQ